MKIIHCADIHLDSAMTSHSDPESARKRRGEMLRTFERMVSYAAREGVSAILIAGDLFDAPNTRELTRNTVLHCIASNPAIAFFYLKGNHDDNNFLNGLDELGKKPCNLMLFGRNWTAAAAVCSAISTRRPVKAPRNLSRRQSNSTAKTSRISEQQPIHKSFERNAETRKGLHTSSSDVTKVSSAARSP